MKYFAVHLISQSCDHYNMLLKADTPKQLAQAASDNCIDFAYIDQVFVEGEDLDYKETKKYSDAIYKAIKVEYDKEN